LGLTVHCGIHVIALSVAHRGLKSGPRLAHWYLHKYGIGLSQNFGFFHGPVAVSSSGLDLPFQPPPKVMNLLLPPGPIFRGSAVENPRPPWAFITNLSGGKPGPSNTAMTLLSYFCKQNKN
jgi:hypothetical protein